jgi:hypothetical protein
MRIVVLATVSSSPHIVFETVGNSSIKHYLAGANSGNHATINQKVNAGNEARIGSQQPAAHVRDIAEAIGANPGPRLLA